MIKHLLAVLLCLSGSLAFSADVLEPIKAIKQFGAITINDGSSFFTFSEGGAFRSGPLGISGRTMNGYWSVNDDGQFIVTVRLGWVNGISARNQYRRIVFHISHVSKRAGQPGSAINPGDDFDSYFLIEEMTTISKPEKPIPE